MDRIEMHSPNIYLEVRRLCEPHKDLIDVKVRRAKQIISWWIHVNLIKYLRDGNYRLLRHGNCFDEICAGDKKKAEVI